MPNERLKLMCVLAHPDDESLGTGGTLARYSAEGVETFLITATRGQMGRFGRRHRGEADPVEVGRVREEELRSATRLLGVKETIVLDLMDGEVDRADAAHTIAEIAGHIRRVKPHVIITFGPDGAYGHPDHIAIAQYTVAAITAAASAGYKGADSKPLYTDPHLVSKLYYMVWSKAKWDAFERAFRKLIVNIDGIDRQASPWKEWQITTEVDTMDYWKTAWEAILCHKTQLSIYDKLKQLPEEHHHILWGSQEFFRVYSLVNNGRTRETDLFEGLR